MLQAHATPSDEDPAGQEPVLTASEEHALQGSQTTPLPKYPDLHEHDTPSTEEFAGHDPVVTADPLQTLQAVHTKPDP